MQIKREKQKYMKIEPIAGEREREGSKKIKTSLKSIISFCKHELVLLNI